MRLEKPLYVANCGSEAVVLERFDLCWQSRWSCGSGCWWALSCSAVVTSCCCLRAMAALTDCPCTSGACGTRVGLGQAAPGVSWEGSPPSSMVSCPVVLRNILFLDEQGEEMPFNESGMWDII